MSVRYFNLAALCMTTLLCVPCRGQQASTPTSGYVLPDGSVRIIGAPETEGMTGGEENRLTRVRRALDLLGDSRPDIRPGAFSRGEPPR